MSKKQSIQKEVISVFTIAILILLIIGLVTIHNIQEYADASQWVAHTHQVIFELEAAFSDLKDAESGQRGFLITGDKIYLHPYWDSREKLKVDLAELKALLADNPEQQQQFKILEPLIAGRLEMLQSGIDLYRKDGYNSANAFIAVGKGRVYMGQVRQQIQKMEILENQYLAIRDKELSRNAQKTIMTLLVGSFFVFLLLVLAYYLINREMNKRQDAEDKATGLNNLLEDQVERLQIEVAERRKAENKVLELNSQLKRQVATLDTLNTNLNAVNQELEAFSYSVSHDLRSPLRSLDGFSVAMLEDYSDKLDETGKGYLNRIRSNSQRMGQLIDDMLTLSRLSRSEMNYSQINLSAVASDIIGELRELEPERQVETSIAPDLVAEGDFHLIRAVLQNLLNNAWKFTQKIPDARIEFGASQIEGEKVYFVRDNGVGFDMAYVGKLFGAFQRLHAMTEYPGTGVGLATVQRIIRRHGGRVWAEGEINRGATFYFTLNTTDLRSDTNE